MFKFFLPLFLMLSFESPSFAIWPPSFRDVQMWDGRNAFEARRFRDALAALRTIPGEPEANYLIGAIYLNGSLEVPQDLAQAAIYFQTASDQGYMSAKFQLGLLYLRGQGVPQNDATAASLFMQAAQAKNKDAMLQAAKMLEAGRGVPFNYALAAEYYLLSESVAGRAAFMALMGRIPIPSEVPPPAAATPVPVEAQPAPAVPPSAAAAHVSSDGCKICFERELKVVFQPCKHLGCCRPCADALLEPKKCPFCGDPIVKEEFVIVP